MNKILLCAAICLLAAASAPADRIAWNDGRLWDDVMVTGYRVVNGVPQFYVEPSDESSPADLKPGWFSGARRIEFDRPEPGTDEPIDRPAAAYPSIEAMVVSVVQGDTLRLDNGQRVRLLGVDTPETTDPDRPLEFFGREAILFTKKMAEGRRVRIEFDQRRMDNYGRLLGYVYILPEQKMLNLAIVESGHGHAWTGEPMSRERTAQFREAESLARERRAGLWDPEERETAYRSWQFVEPSAIAASPGKDRSRSSRSTYARSSRSRHRPRRSIQVEVEYSERPVPIFTWPFPSLGRQIEYRVTPR